MAHELTTNQNGEVEMAYAGNKPWHGLGQQLDAPATAAEAIKAANIGWTVSRRDLITLDGAPAEEWKAITRDDNCPLLFVLWPY